MNGFLALAFAVVVIGQHLVIRSQSWQLFQLARFGMLSIANRADNASSYIAIDHASMAAMARRQAESDCNCCNAGPFEVTIGEFVSHATPISCPLGGHET